MIYSVCKCVLYVSRYLEHSVCVCILVHSYIHVFMTLYVHDTVFTCIFIIGSGWAQRIFTGPCVHSAACFLVSVAWCMHVLPAQPWWWGQGCVCVFLHTHLHSVSKVSAGIFPSRMADRSAFSIACEHRSRWCFVGSDHTSPFHAGVRLHSASPWWNLWRGYLLGVLRGWMIDTGFLW